MSQAGHYIKEQILSSFVRLIATTPDLQTYSVQKLYTSLKADITQEGLTLAGAWVIGEYGDSLLRGGQYEEEELVQVVHESDIVDLLSTILSSSFASQAVTEYILTALIKLTTRLKDAAQIDRIRRLLQSYSASLDVEIQQRAVEYGNLFGYDQVRRGVLEKMPAPEIREEQRVLGEATGKSKKKSSGGKKQPGGKASEQDMLLDLMGGGEQPTREVNGSQKNADLLADILGGTTSSLTPQPSVQTAPRADTSATTDLLGSMSSPSPAPTGEIHKVYQKNQLELSMQVKRLSNSEAGGTGVVQITARFINTAEQRQKKKKISGLALQAAVPKTQKLQMQGISRTEIEPGQEAVQVMRVMGSSSSSNINSTQGVSPEKSP